MQPKFPTHRPVNSINVCCLKLLSFSIVSYPAKINLYTTKLPDSPPLVFYHFVIPTPTSIYFFSVIECVVEILNFFPSKRQKTMYQYCFILLSLLLWMRSIVRYPPVCDFIKNFAFLFTISMFIIHIQQRNQDTLNPHLR